MKTLTLKTNIMCDACIAKVSPVFDQLIGAGKWNVDIKNPKKPLTVQSETLSEQELIKAVEQAGYKAEPLV